MVDTKTTASDPIGTIRREEHAPDGTGYSVWVKIGERNYSRAVRESFASTTWLCVHSTAVDNLGEKLPNNLIERDDSPIVGHIPGTPAAEQSVTR